MQNKDTQTQTVIHVQCTKYTPRILTKSCHIHTHHRQVQN